MRYLAKTAYKPCTLRVIITAKNICNVNFLVHDSVRKNTYFMRRSRTFVAGETKPLYCQMPVTGSHVVAAIFEQGMSPDAKPVNFEVVKIEVLSLPRLLDAIDWKNSKVREFIPFAQKFAFNAGVMPAYENKLYVSNSGKFKIKFLPVIYDEGSGEPLTPARVGVFDKVIEVSRAKFVNMTVPMRICILFHEFSHLWVNEDMKNELEADLNGLIIYLGLGYPRIEAHETFLSTFYDAPSDENMQRYDRISDFIDNFEKIYYGKAA